MSDRDISMMRRFKAQKWGLLCTTRTICLATAVFAVSCVADDIVGSSSGSGTRSEVRQVKNVRGIELPLIANLDVTPSGRKVVRPDCISSEALLYVSYLDLSTAPKRAFGMVAVNEKFETIWTSAIPGGPGNATDMRVANGGIDEMWCAFETNFRMKPWGNMLNLAMYSFASGKLELSRMRKDIARGNLLSPPRFLPEPGDELTDDPTPFYHDGKYYILTRRFESPTLIVRAYSRDFKLLSEHNLDLRESIGDQFMRVNTLVMLEDGPFLVAGVNNGPRMLPGRDGSILGFPLKNDLTGLRGKQVVLVATSAYEDYASGALYRDGKLYIVHVVEAGKNRSDTYQGYLRVYDTKRGFALMATVAVNYGYGGALKDNHLSLAFFNGKICVAHYTPNARLMIRVYGELETVVASDYTWTDYRVLEEKPDTAQGESTTKNPDLMKDFDRNRDGIVTREEFPGPARAFDSLDSNGNGNINMKEALAIPHDHGTEAGRNGKKKDFIVDFDLNGDGKVSRSEFPGPEKIFSRLDQNKDEEVTASEAANSL